MDLIKYIEANPSVKAEDKPRLTKQCREILAALRSGPKLNHELAPIGIRYSARIGELRKAGYEIETEHVANGVHKYTLRE